MFKQLGLLLFKGFEDLGSVARTLGGVHPDVELHAPRQGPVDVHLAADEVAHGQTRVKLLLPVNARQTRLPVVRVIRDVPRDLREEVVVHFDRQGALVCRSHDLTQLTLGAVPRVLLTVGVADH